MARETDFEDPSELYAVMIKDAQSVQKGTLSPEEYTREIVAEMIRLQAELRKARDEAEMASRDDLVKELYRRARFVREIDQTLFSAHEIGNTEKKAIPVAVLAIDADRFKITNDTHGHAGGNLALKGIGEVLGRYSKRRLDTAGRIGGDEFALGLWDTGVTGALTVGEQIRSGVISTCQRINIEQTVSIGVYIAGPEDTAETALQKADIAAYHSKLQRNKVTLYTPELTMPTHTPRP